MSYYVQIYHTVIILWIKYCSFQAMKQQLGGSFCNMSTSMLINQIWHWETNRETQNTERKDSISKDISLLMNIVAECLKAKIMDSIRRSHFLGNGMKQQRPSLDNGWVKLLAQQWTSVTAATRKAVFATTDKTQLFDNVFSLQSAKDSLKRMAKHRNSWEDRYRQTADD
jgi:hypothetical protein